MLNVFLNNFSNIILFSGILIIFSIYFIYRKDLSKIYNSKILFILVFFFFLYKIPQGFDITDEGFTLTKSWFMFNGAWHENVDMMWGSNFINGLWLNLAGMPQLLWARIGFALTVGLNLAIVYKILILFFEKKESFLIVSLLSILVPFGMPQTANYQNLSTVFVLFAVFMFLKGYKSHRNANILISGIFSIFVVAMKFPLIIILIYFGLFYIITFLRKKDDRNKTVKSALFYFYGVIIGFSILFIVLYFTRSIENYIFSVIERFKTSEELDPTHTIPNLIKVYLNDIKLIFLYSVFLSAFFFLLIFVWKKINSFFLRILFIVLSGILLFVFSIKFHVYQNWIYIILAFELTSLFFFLIFDYKKIEKYFSLIFFATLMFFSAFSGSDMGFRLHMWSGAGVFFGSVFLLLLFQLNYKIKNNLYQFKPLIYMFFIYLFLINISLYSNYIYRDDSRNKLTSDFCSQPLKGIKSTDARVNVTDSLLSFLKDNLNENQKIVVVGTMPMIYYLSDKKPIFKDLWRQPVSEFRRYIKKNNLPDIFIFPLKSPRNKKWPSGKSKIIERDKKNILYYKNFVIVNSFKQVFQNSMFELYQKFDKVEE